MKKQNSETSSKRSQKLKNFLQKHVKASDTLILAISGGPDSMAMLDMIRKCHKKIIVGHFNHNVRKNSDKDALFVKETAKKLCVPFECAKMKRTKKDPSEAQMRDARFRFLRKIKKKHRATYILTAHHLDDLAETMILNIMRGTGYKGLIGIKPHQKDILHPLLKLKKSDLITYCKTNKLAYIIDESNTDEKYTRNFIRAKIIPIFKEKNPNWLEKMHILSDSLSNCDEILESKAKEWIKEKFKKNCFNKKEFRSQNENLKAQIICHITEESEQSTQIYKIVECLTNASTGRNVNYKNHIFSINKESICISNKNAKRKNPQQASFQLKTGKKHSLDAWQITSRVIKRKGLQSLKKQNCIFLDEKDIKKNIYVRHAKTGDSFKPLGMKGKSQKLQDFFVNEGISKTERAHIPIFLSANKEILAIGPFRTSEIAKITKNTVSVLEITCKLQK